MQFLFFSLIALGKLFGQKLDVAHQLIYFPVRAE
jgi:hypothetical protein